MNETYTFLQMKGVNIPQKKNVQSDFGRLALDFIREDCTRLKFDYCITDLNGGSSKGCVPFNFERDIDRLCFENAIGRFLESGTREDAFDVYFCYSEIFKPFGKGYQATKSMIETLSEHEENSSSLLMKHRDHYSHSVYVFLLGLAIYKGNEAIRTAYNKKYQLNPGYEACHSFLENWGMTALFHDIGYPFEIAHQQIKTYVCQLVGIDNKNIDEVKEYAPFVSYKKMDDFITIPLEKKTCVENYFQGNDDYNENFNTIFAAAIERRLGKKYGMTFEKLHEILDKRPKDSQPYMDHAYFGGLILLKRILDNMDANESLSDDQMDILVAIILHNSMFKFEIRGKEKGLSLNDGQPLAYLLMLCDELQCWDRTAYGQNSRTDITPFNFDIQFDTNKIILKYYYDLANEKKAAFSKSFKSMSKGYLDKHSIAQNSYKFLDDIDKIIQLKEFPEMDIQTTFVFKEKKKKLYLSDTNFLNIYDFALALNGRYDQTIVNENLDLELDYDVQNRLQESFDSLTLEFKLSNIAQAKGFATHLEGIGCFYTDRAVDYEVVDAFSVDDLKMLATLEHQRWYQEKMDMGWLYGTDYMKVENPKLEKALTRKHKDIVPFSELSEEDILKDSEPMSCMLKLLYNFDGLRIYRLS